MARRKWGAIQQLPGRPGWYVCFHHDGKKVRRKASNHRDIAAKKLKKIRRLASKGKSLDDILAAVFKEKRGSSLTFKDIAELYKERPSDLENPRKRRTLRNEEGRIDGICRAPWASTPVSDLTRGTIVRWKDTRLRRVAFSTVNREIAMAKRILNWGIEREHCAANPFKKIKLKSEKSRMRDTFLTVKECHAMVSACCPEIRPIVVLALHTGMRRGELLSLRWVDVSPDLKKLFVRKASSKSLKERSIHTNKTVRRVLRDRASATGGIAGESVTPLFSLTENQLRSRYDRARFSCPGLSKERQKKAVFHVLRHTAASLMRAQGVSLWDLMGILGHGTYRMVERYAHLGPDVGLEAALRIDEALSQDDSASDDDGQAGVIAHAG